jgi:hypothetical protein
VAVANVLGISCGVPRPAALGRAGADLSLVGEDRGQVAVGEVTDDRGMPECPTDRFGAHQLGQRHSSALMIRTQEIPAAAASVGHNAASSPNECDASGRLWHLVASAGAGVEGVGQGGVDLEGCLKCNDVQLGDGVGIWVGDDRQVTAAAEVVFKAGFEQRVRTS